MPIDEESQDRTDDDTFPTTDKQAPPQWELHRNVYYRDPDEYVVKTYFDTFDMKPSATITVYLQWPLKPHRRPWIVEVRSIIGLERKKVGASRPVVHREKQSTLEGAVKATFYWMDVILDEVMKQPL